MHANTLHVAAPELSFSLHFLYCPSESENILRALLLTSLSGERYNLLSACILIETRQQHPDLWFRFT